MLQRWAAGRSASTRRNHVFRCSNCGFLLHRYLNAVIEATTSMKTLGGLQLGASKAACDVRCGANSTPVAAAGAANIVTVKGHSRLSSHRSLRSCVNHGDAFRAVEIRQRRTSGFTIRAQSLASPPTQTKQVHFTPAFLDHLSSPCPIACTNLVMRLCREYSLLGRDEAKETWA